MTSYGFIFVFLQFNFYNRLIDGKNTKKLI